MRGVVPRRLNTALPVAASITKAPELEPEPDIAFRRALRALDLLATNRTVNEFDVYVGTSTGSFVGALAANGVTPEEMMRVVNQQVPTPFRDINMGTVLRPNYMDFAKALVLMPLRAVGVIRELAANVTNVGLMDLVFGLAEGLPSGMYSGDGVEQYLREVISDPDRTND